MNIIKKMTRNKLTFVLIAILFSLLYFKFNYVPKNNSPIDSILDLTSINTKLTNGDNLEHFKKLGLPEGYDLLLDNKYYIVGYSYKRKTPIFSAYKVTQKQANITRKREDTFREDKRINKEYRSTLSDYYKNGKDMDRGHLAPNALLDYSRESQDSTFLLSNIIPQHKEHNRKAWADVENIVREIAKNSRTTYILTGVAFDDDKEFIGNGVEIPDYIYKIAYRAEEKEGIAFITPNKYISQDELMSYKFTIDEAEEILGIKFFPNLNLNNK